MGRRLGGEGRVYVYDEVGEVHYFNPGDDVPAWAAKQITNPDAWKTADDDTEPVDADDQTPDDPDADSTDGGDEYGVDYDAMKVDQLKELIDQRNEGRDEDDLIEVEGKGNKPDLIAALQADDAAQADAGDDDA